MVWFRNTKETPINDVTYVSVTQSNRHKILDPLLISFFKLRHLWTLAFGKSGQSNLSISSWHYLFGVILLQECIDVVFGILEVPCGVQGRIWQKEKASSWHPEQSCELRCECLVITYLRTETVISCCLLCFENFCPQNVKRYEKNFAVSQVWRQKTNVLFVFTFDTGLRSAT